MFRTFLTLVAKNYELLNLNRILIIIAQKTVIHIIFMQ